MTNADPSLTLLGQMALERLDENLFRGVSPPTRPGFPRRIYGGQVVAQALQAANRTVEGRPCHSLHVYFLRAGDPDVPIIFEVDRARDGRGFSARRVVAIQNGRQILNLSCSFHEPETGLEHQVSMPSVPNWRDYPDDAALETLAGQAKATFTKQALSATRPIEVRYADPLDFFGETPKTNFAPVEHVWFRARDPIGETQTDHQEVLAYASDLTLVFTALRAHPISVNSPGFMHASLDHAIWFHRPLDFNTWHLFAQDSPTTGGARGFSRGMIFSEDGALVASCFQEGLFRYWPPQEG